MKGSIIRGVMIFMAGAGCATVMAQVGDEQLPPISVEQWQKDATELLPKIALLGQYVQKTNDGLVGIHIDPIACGPRPPVPKLPAGAVDPRPLQRGLAALRELETGYIVQDSAPVFAVLKCKPRGD
ncbi:MAG TPA: hypothetical protein VFO82_12200 [Steroidobacteraceae bacterium]|nr:hypothetical protein [Steroidobacteraceae bacterium]